MFEVNRYYFLTSYDEEICNFRVPMYLYGMKLSLECPIFIKLCTKQVCLSADYSLLQAVCQFGIKSEYKILLQYSTWSKLRRRDLWE